MCLSPRITAVGIWYIGQVLPYFVIMLPYNCVSRDGSRMMIVPLLRDRCFEGWGTANDRSKHAAGGRCWWVGLCCPSQGSRNSSGIRILGGAHSVFAFLRFISPPKRGWWELMSTTWAKLRFAQHLEHRTVSRIPSCVSVPWLSHLHIRGPQMSKTISQQYEMKNMQEFCVCASLYRGRNDPIIHSTQWH